MTSRSHVAILISSLLGFAARGQAQTSTVLVVPTATVIVQQPAPCKPAPEAPPEYAATVTSAILLYTFAPVALTLALVMGMQASSEHDRYQSLTGAGFPIMSADALAHARDDDNQSMAWLGAGLGSLSLAIVLSVVAASIHWDDPAAQAHLGPDGLVLRF